MNDVFDCSLYDFHGLNLANLEQLTVTKGYNLNSYDDFIMLYSQLDKLIY